MKRVKEAFGELKLNVKFTIIIITFVLIPIAVFSMFVFENLENTAIREKVKAMEYSMSSSYDQILKNIDSINMSTQFFLSDETLQDYLVRIKTEEEISTEDMRSFYNVNVASLERMVNNNPYLYQIRVYAESSSMQEMMPILYSKDRMEKLSWASDTDLTGWKYDYIDTIFDSFVMNQNKKIMSLVTPIEEYGYGEIGVLEVAMSMETMFPGIYEQTEDEWSCFVEDSGDIYFGELSEEEIQKESKYVNVILADTKVTEQMQTYYTKINKEPVVVGYLPVKELSGTVICVCSVQPEINRIHQYRNIFILIMLFILVMLVLLIHVVVKSLLHQFYDIMHSIREVQKGDLDVVIENCGNDEVGELGTQINKMLSRIKELMEENLNRELLVKNSEVRALQNQINAHFIYNVLESIKMMAEIDEKYEISDAITALGKLLRYGMKWVSRYVTVREEIEYIKNYLTLINLRFDYEIYLSLNLSERMMQQKIPKMTIQPIVENAIYHGVEQMAEDTSIYIKGREEDGDCVIEITDSGKGMTEEEVKKLYQKLNGEIETSGGSGNGIGLKNVQDRIKIGFGENYGIQIYSKLGCYTKILVRIPMVEEGE